MDVLLQAVTALADAQGRVACAIALLDGLARAGYVSCAEFPMQPNSVGTLPQVKDTLGRVLSDLGDYAAQVTAKKGGLSSGQ